MRLSPTIRYLFVNAAVLLACSIEFVRGYHPVIVLTGALTFLFVGNLIVYLSGSKQRALRRQQKRDYWAR